MISIHSLRSGNIGSYTSKMQVDQVIYSDFAELPSLPQKTLLCHEIFQGLSSSTSHCYRLKALIYFLFKPLQLSTFSNKEFDSFKQFLCSTVLCNKKAQKTAQMTIDISILNLSIFLLDDFWKLEGTIMDEKTPEVTVKLSLIYWVSSVRYDKRDGIRITYINAST